MCIHISLCVFMLSSQFTYLFTCTLYIVNCTLYRLVQIRQLPIPMNSELVPPPLLLCLRAASNQWAPARRWTGCYHIAGPIAFGCTSVEYVCLSVCQSEENWNGFKLILFQINRLRQLSQSCSIRQCYHANQTILPYRRSNRFFKVPCCVSK